MSPNHGDNSGRSPQFHRKIRSFVRREGRMSKRQSAAYESLFQKYGLQFQAQAFDLVALFERNAPTILEIGFGMGDSLAAMAKANPNTNFIGIEVHRPGVGSLLAMIEEQGINNIRIFCHDAVEVLDQSLPDQCLDGIHIFFPDPWPKKRHFKRRLIQAEFVTQLSLKLNPHGKLHIATDWQNYAEWIEEIVSGNSNFFRLSEETAHQRPITKFEKRGLELGHNVWDMIYEKKS